MGKPTRSFISVGPVNDAMPTEQDAIRNDMEVARTLLRQMQDNFNNLEAKVLRFQDSH